MRKIWDYIKPSIEGRDGHLSYRRVSAIVVLMLIVKMVMDRFINNFEVQVIYGLIVFFLLLTGMITADQLIRIKNGNKSKEDEEKH